MLNKLNPRQSLGFLTWKVARLKTNDLAARFAEAGLEITVEQWRVLIPIFKAGSMPQGKLCDILSQEKTGVSRLAAALEKRGYVRREAGKQDRRVKTLHITDAGRELMMQTFDLAKANMISCEERLDPEELGICRKVLWEILEPTLDDACFPEER
ncbi:MAG: MarR family transcriptional regulator [Desulfovibrionaceae bacterium]|nr:MarR family transcriptional regulator [Desulfovibrionaceae bacterium]